MHHKVAMSRLAGESFGWFSIVILVLLSSATAAAAATVPDYTTSEAGNPFVEGWYADPDTAYYQGNYWVYATSSLPYEEQTYFDAFSSPDLVNWTKHTDILTIANVSWAHKAVWAPAPAYRDGKYYLYFGANDIQEDEAASGAVGGIGVAVADRPEGPYVDPLGHPLIGDYHYGAQPIDQAVFIDDADGQAYMYYGGHGHANVAKLNADMVSLGTFDDGATFRSITPEHYVESAQMFKRHGVYYLMWSEGGWGGPDYSVAYAMAASPLGPFVRRDRILAQDPAVARGCGHNGVINVPGTDIWYIVYHRRPLSETDGNHRVLAYDRMYFRPDGTIQRVQMLVHDNFADGSMIGWTTHSGIWTVADGRLRGAGVHGAMALLDTDFEDVVFEATVSLTRAYAPMAEAGLMFRAAGQDGYYAALSPKGRVTLRKGEDGRWTTLGEVPVAVSGDAEHTLRVEAVGSNIRVFVDDHLEAHITAEDDSFRSGATGVRVFHARAAFGSVSVESPRTREDAGLLPQVPEEL